MSLNISKRKSNVIHVELSEPYQGRCNWYFGSVAAIYEEIPKDTIGVSLEYLWQKLRGNDEYKTRTGTVIRKSVVISKEHVNAGRPS